MIALTLPDGSPCRSWSLRCETACGAYSGRDLDKEELIEGFQSCKVSGEMRFQVGDAVKVRVADFVARFRIRCSSDRVVNGRIVK